MIGTHLILNIPSCSNVYNKRHGQYGPVSVHVNEERVNLFSEEGTYVGVVQSDWSIY